MRWIVCTLLLLTTGLQVATAASKHVSDVDKVKQVASFLEGVSKKLAHERSKEAAVYKQIRQHCNAYGAGMQTAPEPGIVPQKPAAVPKKAEKTVKVLPKLAPMPKKVEQAVKMLRKPAAAPKQVEKTATVLIKPARASKKVANTAEMLRKPAPAPKEVEKTVEMLHKEVATAKTLQKPLQQRKPSPAQQQVKKVEKTVRKSVPAPKKVEKTVEMLRKEVAVAKKLRKKLQQQQKMRISTKAETAVKKFQRPAPAPKKARKTVKTLQKPVPVPKVLVIWGASNNANEDSGSADEDTEISEAAMKVVRAAEVDNAEIASAEKVKHIAAEKTAAAARWEAAHRVLTGKLSKAIDVTPVPQPPQLAVQQSIPKASPEQLDLEDPSADVAEMNSLLNSAEKAEIGVSSGTAETETLKQPWLDAKQVEAALGVKPVAPAQKPASVAKPATKTRVKSKAVTIAKVTPKQPLDVLSDIVKQAVEPEDQKIPSTEPVSTVALPDKKRDAATVEAYEPLAEAVLSIDTPAEEDAGIIVPPPDPAEEPEVLHIQRVPDRQAAAPLYAHPDMKVAEAEFGETADEVASLEKDLAPPTPPPAAKVSVPSKVTTPSKVADTTAGTDVVAKAVSKAQKQVEDASAIADMSQAFGDLGGAVPPSIDKQAMQFYNSFGGEPASLETLGGLPGMLGNDGPSFLQVTREDKQPTKLDVDLAPAVRADLDSAMDALKEVADNTQNALSMMDLLRQTEETAITRSAYADQCEVLLQEFGHRQEVLAGREAELRKRSQQLTQSLLRIGHEQKRKHLRSHH